MGTYSKSGYNVSGSVMLATNHCLSMRKAYLQPSSPFTGIDAPYTHIEDLEVQRNCGVAAVNARAIAEVIHGCTD